MNTGLAILSHALRMLIFDTATTLRVLMPALLIVLGATVAIAFFAPEMLDLMGGPAEDMAPPAPATAVLFIVFALVAIAGYTLMAILWHRHVLLDGAKGLDGVQPDAGIFFGYLWRAILVACVQILAAIPVTLAMGLLATLLVAGLPLGLAGLLVGIGGGIVFVWIALRVSVVLPAAALARPMTIRESWATTAPLSGPLWGLALLLTGLNALVGLLLPFVIPPLPVFAAAIHTVVFVAEGLIFISVLTTLYGHLVEGRSLGQ